MKRAQVWSIDVLLALVIFIAVILIFYTTLNAKQNPRLKELQSVAGELKEQLEQGSGIGFLESGNVEFLKLQNLSLEIDKDYLSIKQQLGLSEDFCIFFEDEEGNLIYFDEESGRKVGIGVPSDTLLINGKRCGSVS